MRYSCSISEGFSPKVSRLLCDRSLAYYISFSLARFNSIFSFSYLIASTIWSSLF
jgi:hypothetical protein